MPPIVHSHISNFMPPVQYSAYPRSLPIGRRLTRSNAKRNVRKRIQFSNNISRRNYNRTSAPGLLRDAEPLNTNQMQYLLGMKALKKTVKNVRQHDPDGNYRANKIARGLTRLHHNRMKLPANDTLNNGLNANYMEAAENANLYSYEQAEAARIFANIHRKLPYNLEAKNNIYNAFAQELNMRENAQAPSIRRKIVRKLFKTYRN